MKLLEALVSAPFAQALGWTLVHSLWQGAIIATALTAALGAMRSARARYAAAWVAMLAMLVIVGFTLVWLVPGEVSQVRSSAVFPFPAWHVRTSGTGAGPSAMGLGAIVPWLAPFWILGVWTFALSQIAGWIWIVRLRRRGVCRASERWQQDIVRLGARLHLVRPVILLESCLAEVPMVAGYIRPVILIPIGILAGLSPGQIEGILLHELAHIRRHDYLVNLLQRVVESLLFYHPAVWWISRVIRTERENCCDDLAVAASGDVQEYAIALTTLEQNRGSGREPAVAATGGSLVKRIHRLLYPSSANGLWTPLLAAAVLVATTVVALAEWPQQPLGQSLVDQQQWEDGTLAFPVEPVTHFRLAANSQKVFETLGRLAGMKVAFTPDFRPAPISVDFTNERLEDAFVAVARQAKCFLKPIPANSILVIPDTQENRRKYQYSDHGLLSAIDGESHDGNETNRGQGAEVSPYDRWKNEEVVYIITDEERSAFEKLTTDEERDEFVKLFWERRNPNPGSSENQFKKEFYHRIAYANGHFSADKQGWKTDRGHMYIIYGPPDEIDSHPGNKPYAFEVWTYQHLEGVGNGISFTFVDQTGKGEFDLATPPWKWPVKKNSPPA